MSEYKDTMYAKHWLRTALQSEKEKYAAVPVKADLVPNHMYSQAWGYVFVAYRLIEMGFKLIWATNGGDGIFRGHGLAEVWSKLSELDQKALSLHYADSCQYGRGYPFGYDSLNAFLENLDNGSVGWPAWGYFPIENFKKQDAAWVDNRLPQVDIGTMHDIVRSCLWWMEAKRKGYSLLYGSRSWSEHRRRWHPGGKLWAWMTVQMNRPLVDPIWHDLDQVVITESSGLEGFAKGDRVEILWGPDYAGRHDYLICQGEGIKGPGFGSLPEETPDLPHRDRRDELADFDPKEGLRDSGMSL